MIWLTRLKNIWAWSAYHPSSPPEEMGFSWAGFKKPEYPKNVLVEGKVIKNQEAKFIRRMKEDPIKRLTQEDAQN